MKIDKNKQYVTLEGLAVKIYEVYTGKGNNSVHGAINVNGTWLSRDWGEDGRYMIHGPSFNDLVEITK